MDGILTSTNRRHEARPGWNRKERRREAGMLRARLFLSSYAILFAILALRFDGSVLRGTCAALAAIGALTTVAWFRAARNVQPTPYIIAEVTDRGGEVAGYLATYLLPFRHRPNTGSRRCRWLHPLHACCRDHLCSLRDDPHQSAVIRVRVLGSVRSRRLRLARLPHIAGHAIRG